MNRRIHLGLRGKMTVIVFGATLALVSLFAYLGTAALDENIRRTLQERVVLAQATARHIDYVLANVEIFLSQAATQENWSDSTQVNAALDRTHRRLSSFAHQVYFIPRAGDASALPASAALPVSAVLEGKPFAVSHFAGPNEVCAATPVRDASGAIIGALALQINLSGAHIRAFTHPIGLGKTGTMDLIDVRGAILASTHPDRVGNQSDHRNTLAGLIRDQRTAVSACHDCHTAPTEAEPRPEVLAFAPLERAQWGITVRQSEDEVFAGARALQFRISALLVISIACACVIVYVTTRQVIEPVRALTHATRQIARGDLASPITARGSDELGALAQSFETMRARLQNSIAEIQSWNRTLDARVQERTAALERAMQENARLYAELQKKERARGELLRRVITAQEDERRRIARELHDEMSQSLTALLVGLDTVQLARANNLTKAEEHLRACKSIADGLLNDVHRLIADLRPTLLDDLGLVPAITWYGTQRLNPLGIALRVDDAELRARLPAPLETTFFRIAQEALTNIVRHARATRVVIRLASTDAFTTLQISDDGQGFDPQSAQAEPGFGLHGIQERINILGGEFDLQTAPGQGVALTIRVPRGENGNGKDSRSAR